MGAGQGQIQHIFPLSRLNGFEITFQHLHFLLHSCNVFRCESFALLGGCGFRQLVFGCPQNQRFKTSIRVVVGTHHQFRDFNLTHPIDPAQQLADKSTDTPSLLIHALLKFQGLSDGVMGTSPL